MDSISVRSFTTKRDGLVIRGDIYGTEGPVVIISHGFLATGKTGEAYAVYLVKNGFTALTFDFSGGGPGSASDGKSEDMTVFTEVKDLEAVIAYAQDTFPGKPIILMGMSQGGFVSALTAAGRDDISKLVLLFPALCIPDDSMTGDMLIYRFDPEDIPDIIGEVPMRLGGDYARSMQGFDWEKAISSYGGTVLLIHGTADNIVNIDYSRRAVALYADARLIEVEGASHGFEGEDLERVLGEIKAFLEG